MFLLHPNPIQNRLVLYFIYWMYFSNFKAYTFMKYERKFNFSFVSPSLGPPMGLEMCLHAACMCACAGFLPMQMKKANQPYSVAFCSRLGCRHPGGCPVICRGKHCRSGGCSALAEPQCCLPLGRFQFYKECISYFLLVGQDTLFNTESQVISTFKLHGSTWPY